MQNVANLKAPEEVHRHVRDFLTLMTEAFGGELASIFAFGSVVTGDFDAQSDVNLMVVVSELDIAELSPALAGKRSAIKKRRLAPRFISKRNLHQSTRYFQIDFLEMRDAHVLLWGEDLLTTIALSPLDLRWQIAYEIKAMRMRLKQQFWRFDGDAERMREVLIDRFTALVHILRAAILLFRGEAPLLREDILSTSSQHLGIDRNAAAGLLQLRETKKLPQPEALRLQFTQLMEIVRAVDDRIEAMAP